MIRYRVSHCTSYRYGAPVTDAYSVACLLPRERPNQHVVDARVWADPNPDEYDEHLDVFGNRIVQLGVHRRHETFEITAESTVEVAPMPVPSTTVSWEEVATLASALRGSDAVDIGPYRAATTASSPIERDDLLVALADDVFRPGRPLIAAVDALTTTIFENFHFDPSATDLATPLDAVLDQRSGVCQDFAHLALAACRRVGLAARYVSGYIETDPPPGEATSIGADASHAWLSIWVPEYGWFDSDPTNNQSPPTRHVTVGWGRDYADVAPVRGVVIGPSTQQTMAVSVDVSRIN